VRAVMGAPMELVNMFIPLILYLGGQMWSVQILFICQGICLDYDHTMA
jgi:hypothetical protein